MNVRGLNVVVTGKVAGESRLTAEAKLRDAGATVQSSVSKTTDLLLTGDKVGARKTQDAAALGVRVMPWEQAMNGSDGDAADRRTEGRRKAAPVLPSARQVAPMLARAGELPADNGWLFEIKWDGLRCVATVDADGLVAMQSRSAKTAYTEQFPHVARELALLPPGVYDGELVVVGDGQLGSMQSMSKAQSSYVVFDQLEDGSFGDLRRQPLEGRRQVLAQNVNGAIAEHDLKWVAVSPAFDHGDELLQIVIEQGGEGVVAKRRTSVYQEGARPDTWVKVKVRRSSDFAVIGWNPGEGARVDEAGSLLLAAWDPVAGEFVYVGRVGTGKTGSDGNLGADFWRQVTELPQADASECPEAAVQVATRSKLRDVVWVQPQLVVQVRFQRWTEDGRLWHPSVIAVRDDVGPYDTRKEP